MRPTRLRNTQVPFGWEKDKLLIILWCKIKSNLFATLAWCRWTTRDLSFEEAAEHPSHGEPKHLCRFSVYSIDVYSLSRRQESRFRAS